jgi:zinc protease
MTATLRDEQSIAFRPKAAPPAAAPARAARVEELVTPGGVRAYLIHEPALPFLSLAADFDGGAAADPEGRPGLAYVAVGLLDEGAGAYDSQTFRAELEDRAIRLHFDADRDGLSAELKTLTAHRERAFELLRLALTEPRFDPEPVERVRGQVLAELRRLETDPNYLASRAWFARAFPGHPYGAPTRGTPETVAALSRDELAAFPRARLGRDNLVVGVAGDVTAGELAPLLDHAFGGLPNLADRPEVPRADARTGGAPEVVRLPNPQSVAVFGAPALDRLDPDYYAAYVANYVLGGGGFASRLMQEVREKRGLAYSVYSYLFDLKRAPVWLGGVATKNEQVAESVRLIRHELARLAAGELAEQDLADAKTYITGSFALRLTSNDQVAKTLVSMLEAGLGRDYLERRNPLIEAVTLEDVRRVAARLYGVEPLLAVAGAPEGL